MEFQKIVEEVLKEDMTAGGVNSVLGPNVGATATVNSGNNYAVSKDGPDNRFVTSLYGKGVITRKGMSKISKKSKRKKKSK